MPKFELNIAGQKQTIEVNESPVVATVSLPITITPVLPPKPEYLNLLDFGAVADGRTDCLPAITKALASAKSTKKKLYVPPGKYLHSSTFDIDSVEVFGEGDLSEFISNNPNNAAIFLKGTNAVLRSVKHTVNTNGMPRQSSAEHASICAWLTNGFTIENVTCVGGTSIGTLMYGARSGIVRKCRVTKTLADSYHCSNGAELITIRDNWARECADDGVAVVSYTRDAKPCNNISIIANDVGYNSWGRGITVVGGTNVMIEGNIISRTNGAGLLIAAEDSWNTYGVSSVMCSKNSLVECVTNATIGHPAVLVHGRQGYPVSNVVLDNTTVINPRNDAFRFDEFLDKIVVRGSSISGVKSGYQSYRINPKSVSNVTVV